MKEKKEQILVVDDEPRNLQLLGNLLRQEDYAVRFASDGEKAIQGCREKPCDLILLDVMMPGMDGFAVCRALQEDPVTRQIPIIFITARNQPDQIVQGFEVGGVDYITKPFAGQELLARVRTHLELKRTRSELHNTVQELRKANEELRQINDSQRRFFSMIAHDLRSPFNGLRMFPQLLATRFDTMKREEIIKIAQDVEDQVDHVHRFLEELLEWCHYESGQLRIERTTLPLHDCVEAVLAVARAAAYAKDVELRNAVPEDLQAQGDRRMICTILQNLISNAIKFSRRDSEVVIQAKALESNSYEDAGQRCPEVDLSVKDCGIGMPPAVRDSLFELGKRTTTRGTEDERGTGFGLQLTKQFVDLHDGKLIVDSEVGCGTEIHVILPGG